MAIQSINNINTGILNSGINKSNEKTESITSFYDYLKDALNTVNSMQLEADNAINDFAAGRTENIHQVLITMKKADIALSYTIQVRNKLMDAYNEIMRMQI